ncbi:MAG: histidine phosphatase family protein [Pseudomonadales bacterium]|nr:histidine phosphatase family protein [Pseudomonadales bacterium]
MTRQLILLRHAKSSWKDETLADFDRPLSARGVRDGAHFAPRLQDLLPRPDQVLCSPARRTRDTLAFLVPGLVDPRRTSFPPELYLADADRLLQRIGAVAPVAVLLVIAHNPGLTDLLNLLVDRAEDRIDNLPTFGAALLESRDASGFAPGAVRRRMLLTPKSVN